MSVPSDILQQLLQGGLLNYGQPNALDKGLMSGDPSMQLGMQLLANSNTPGNFAGILGRSMMGTQEAQQKNAASQMGLTNTAEDLRMKQMQRQLFMQAYPQWIGALSGQDPSQGAQPQSGSAPAYPAQGAAGVPQGPQTPPQPAGPGSNAVAAGGSPAQPQGQPQGMTQDPFRMLQQGMLGAAMGMPGAQQMIEVAKTRLQYDPNLQTKIEAAKSTVAQDQELIDQALKRGDTATAWGMTQKLQQDMGLIHIASMSGTRTQITPQGIQTVAPNEGMMTFDRGNGNIQQGLIPGAAGAIGIKSAAEAQGRATGEVINLTDPTTGQTYPAPRSVVTGGRGFGAGNPAAPVPGGPFAPPPTSRPGASAGPPLVTSLGPGKQAFLNKQGEDASATAQFFQDKAETAQQMLAQTAEIRAAATDFGPGQFAATRESTLNWLNSLDLITPEEKKQLGSAQVGDKISIQLQAMATKQLGSKEAQQVFATMGKSIPNLTLSDDGLQKITAYMEGISRYDLARAKVVQDRASKGDYAGVNNTRNDFVANSNPSFFVFASARPDVRNSMLKSMGQQQGMRFLQQWDTAIKSGWAPPADIYWGR